MEKRVAGKRGGPPSAGGQGSYNGHQPTLPNVSLDDEEDPRKPFSLQGADMAGYGGGRVVGGPADQDEKYLAPELPPGSEDYHGCELDCQNT